MADEHTGKFVAYLRVSTDRQGQSGLGLEAQRKAIDDYLNGGAWELVAEFVEVESGKKNERPELEKAKAACKKEKATLVIAKLDRLSRNLHFISCLLESKVEFLAVDNPYANRSMIQMQAVFAELERDQISRRTKEALAAAKARGVKLGEHGKILARQHKAVADAHAKEVAPLVGRLQAKGLSVRQIMAELNRLNTPTAKGGTWHVSTTHRLLKRLERLERRSAA